MVPRSPSYDEIGRSYAATRREDPRIAVQIQRALGEGGSVLNVGAGTGNYEPVDGTVVALDASARMLAQRTKRSRLVVRGVAERLPFPDGAFRAARMLDYFDEVSPRPTDQRESDDETSVLACRCARCRRFSCPRTAPTDSVPRFDDAGYRLAIAGN